MKNNKQQQATMTIPTTAKIENKNDKQHPRCKVGQLSWHTCTKNGKQEQEQHNSNDADDNNNNNNNDVAPSAVKQQKTRASHTDFMNEKATWCL